MEAADEIAKQLRMRNLAGLIVVDFIDMEDPQNNHAVEKRMKEAMKQDRARVQIAKMSCFGLLEISRQRMHSSFMESNYQVCPHCHGQGVVRTTESGAVLILRAIEEEGIKNRSAKISIAVPTETAIYLLNQKRQTLCALEQRYKMEIVICADDGIKNVAEFKLERVKSQKEALEEKKAAEETSDDEPRREENNGRRNNRRSDRRQTQPEEKAAEAENTEIQQQADENGNNESTAENGELNNNRRGAAVTDAVTGEVATAAVTDANAAATRTKVPLSVKTTSIRKKPKPSSCIIRTKTSNLMRRIIRKPMKNRGKPTGGEN